MDSVKPFHAEAVESDIAPFGGDQRLFDLFRVGEGVEQFGEALLAVLKEPLIVPERVVGVEGDGGQRAHDESPSRIRRRHPAG
jgi:hypothetical protein